MHTHKWVTYDEAAAAAAAHGYDGVGFVMERTVAQIQFPAAPLPRLTRVAAYARVSSGKDAMLHSLSAQVSYYSDMIQKHPGWQYAGVYADEAITGTKDAREGFQQLLAACRAGEVDMVITKSISRLARNTVTLLGTVRELKGLGVDVFFEEQNIHTMSADGELMMTILASYAQEESRSASENQLWRIRRNFEAGMPWNGTMLGYRYDHGTLVVVPEEAEIVRDIFSDYLAGMGTGAIVKKLNAAGVRTRNGHSWCRNGVRRVLKNEAYTGGLLLQKTFRENCITKRTNRNEGQLPQYRVQDSHEAIIPAEQFAAVQVEMQRRAGQCKNTGKRRNAYPFSGMVVCGDCGETYGSKVWHSTSKYRRTIWQCNAKFKGEHKCRTPHLYEDDLKEHFISALSRLLADREALLEDGRLILHALADCSALDKAQAQLRQEITVVAGLVENCVRENATRAMDQSEYAARYDTLAARYEKLQSRYDTLRKTRERRQIQANEISGFLFAVYALDTLPLEFDPALWTATVDQVTVHADSRLVFRFRNGAEVEEAV